MTEEQVIVALSFEEGPESVYKAVLAIISSEVTAAINQVSDVATMGESRAFYAGQVAALSDLKAGLEALREQGENLSLDR
jgi:hypothetical protein